MKFDTTDRKTTQALTCLVAFLILILNSGCIAVDVSEQRLVSKPNMLFSDSMVYNYDSQILPQIEPGAALSGGAQTAGCTACK